MFARGTQFKESTDDTQPRTKFALWCMDAFTSSTTPVRNRHEG
jgi:hypothetical protein